ncbi:MAG TPA: type II toxin-antitoxin system VapC family toxin [Bacteroidota bacterium]
MRIYIDTSVIGGYYDEEYKQDSQKLVEKFISGEHKAVVSELTEAELNGAPVRVQKILELIPDYHIEYLELTEEAVILANKYIDEKVLPASMLPDAEHIALATIHRVDVLVSWNFKHIVNLEKIRGYNSVNIRLGYPTIEIRTPKEVLSYES